MATKTEQTAYPTKKAGGREVLVPLDGSAFAEAVLPTAVSLAALEGVEITLVTVVKPSEPHATWAGFPVDIDYAKGRVDLTGGLLDMPPEIGGGMLAETRGQAEERAQVEAAEYLERVAHRHFPDLVRTAVLKGEDVAGELATYAREHGIDFIAMATHGRTGLAHLLMGSVASRLLRAKVAPVLLVRPDHLPAVATR